MTAWPQVLPRREEMVAGFDPSSARNVVLAVVSN